MIIKKQFFLTIFILLSYFYSQSQINVSKDKVTYINDLVYYKGKLFTGTLYDSQQGIKNDCHCISISIYENGKIISKKIYNTDGSLQKKETFKNGSISSSIIYKRNNTPKNNIPTADVVVSIPKKTNSQTIISPTIIYSQNTSNSILNTNNGLSKIFYPNGKIKRVTFHKNGLLVKDSLFYNNGSLKMTKKFSDGELIHQEKYSDKNILLKEINLLNNKKEGIQRENFENGEPKIIEEYNNGNLVHYEAYFENGNLKQEKNYKFNKKNGGQKLFDSSGKLLSLEVYDMGKLIKNEIYENNFKKIISHINGLIETKKYNKNDQLIKLQYIDEKTKQKDSLWIEFDSVTGNKLKEKAYVNAKKTREGQYTDNKKDGIWKYYAQNGLSETKIVYQMGKKINSKRLIYAKQIKNNFKKGDVIYNYFIPKAKKKNNYVLFRIDSTNNLYTTQIKDTIQVIIKNHFKAINNLNDISEIELSSILNITDLKYRFRPQKTNLNKFIAYIATTLSVNNLSKDSIFKTVISVTPANEKHPNVNSFYRKNKQVAFLETLANLKQKVSFFLEKNYPKIGVIYRTTQQNSKEISEVSVYFENSKNIKEKDVFVVFNNNSETNIQLKVSKISNHIIICKVVSDKDKLKQLLLQQKNPIVKKIVIN